MNKTTEETIEAARASAKQLSDRVIKALSTEQLLLFAVVSNQMLEIQSALVKSGNYKVWREVLASMNHIEAGAEKHFGKEFMDTALREEEES